PPADTKTSAPPWGPSTPSATRTRPAGAPPTPATQRGSPGGAARARRAARTTNAAPVTVTTAAPWGNRGTREASRKSKKGPSSPVVAPASNAASAGAVRGCGADALIDAAAARKAARASEATYASRPRPVAASHEPGFVPDTSESPASIAKIASATRVARRAPAFVSDHPASHAAEAPTSVQPSQAVARPPARNERRPPESESSSQAHDFHGRGSTSGEARRVPRFAAAASATTQASVHAHTDRRSNASPNPTSSAPRRAPPTAGSRRPPAPLGARASANSWPRSAADAERIEPTPRRRGHGSYAPPAPRRPRTSCQTNAAKGGATTSQRVRETTRWSGSDIGASEFTSTARLYRNGLRWPSPPADRTSCRRRWMTAIATSIVAPTNEPLIRSCAARWGVHHTHAADRARAARARGSRASVVVRVLSTRRRRGSVQRTAEIASTSAAVLPRSHAAPAASSARRPSCCAGDSPGNDQPPRKRTLASPAITKRCARRAASSHDPRDRAGRSDTSSTSAEAPDAAASRSGSMSAHPRRRSVASSAAGLRKASQSQGAPPWAWSISWTRSEPVVRTTLVTATAAGTCCQATCAAPRRP